MWNKELYVREQQDAYEFFTSLIDQMDEYLKVICSTAINILYYLTCISKTPDHEIILKTYGRGDQPTLDCRPDTVLFFFGLH